MKDMLENEIRIGDKIIYTSDHYGVKLTIGLVLDVSSNSAKIKRLEDGKIYQGIKNGLMTISSWNSVTKKYDTVQVCPRTVVIGMSQRCFVIESAGK